MLSKDVDVIGPLCELSAQIVELFVTSIVTIEAGGKECLWADGLSNAFANGSQPLNGRESVQRHRGNRCSGRQPWQTEDASDCTQNGEVVSFD